MSLSLDEIKAELRKEIEALSKSKIEDDDQDVLFKTSFLDSLHRINIVLFIEARFSVPVDPFFTERDRVDSLNKIARYIQESAPK